MEDNTKLVLIGRTGNGKSATGNSILGRADFTARSHYDPSGVEPLKASSDGKLVTVVDGLDIDDEIRIKSLREKGREIFTLIENITAFLIVLKYGVRFGKADEDAISVIRSIFGKNVLRSHGIVVLSHGDNFDKDNYGHSFEDWCAEQTGKAKALFEECGSRVVLFDNYAERKKDQYDRLMFEVSKITTSRIGPYTLKDLDEVIIIKRERWLEEWCCVFIFVGCVAAAIYYYPYFVPYKTPKYEG